MAGGIPVLGNILFRFLRGAYDIHTYRSWGIARRWFWIRRLVRKESFSVGYRHVWYCFVSSISNRSWLAQSCRRCSNNIKEIAIRIKEWRRLDKIFEKRGYFLQFQRRIPWFRTYEGALTRDCFCCTPKRYQSCRCSCKDCCWWPIIF